MKELFEDWLKVCKREEELDDATIVFLKLEYPSACKNLFMQFYEDNQEYFEELIKETTKEVYGLS